MEKILCKNKDDILNLYEIQIYMEFKYNPYYSQSKRNAMKISKIPVERISTCGSQYPKSEPVDSYEQLHDPLRQSLNGQPTVSV